MEKITVFTDNKVVNTSLSSANMLKIISDKLSISLNPESSYFYWLIIKLLIEFYYEPTSMRQLFPLVYQVSTALVKYHY